MKDLCCQSQTPAASVGGADVSNRVECLAPLALQVVTIRIRERRDRATQVGGALPMS